MPLGKCIVNDTVKKRVYYPLSAVVKLEGNKKPDTLEATFTAENKIKESYEISYIQDVVDTTYLRAVYPMQLSCLDESGNDNDPATDPVETRFVNVTTGKFKGHYALDFNADGQGVSITDPRSTINISKQFDIHIWFTPNTTQLVDGSDEPLLWSFRDSSDPRGIEIGITGTNGINSSWRVYIRESNGSITNGHTGSSELIMTGSPVHIRVKRGQDNLVKAYVNGVEDISFSSSADYQPTVATNMIFGDSPSSTNDEFSGQIHEIKVYTGSELSENDAKKIRWTKPIVQYMKFAGRVRKLTSNQTTKKAICQSNSYELIKAKLGDSGAVNTQLFSTPFKTIAQNAINNAFLPLSSPFTIRVLDSFAHIVSSNPLIGSIYEVGSLTEFLNTLLLYADMVMYVTPRRNIIVETKSTLNPSAGKLTNYVFDQGGAVVKYNIKNTEDNDTNLINKVILYGRGSTADESAFTPNDGIRRTLRRNAFTLDNKNNLKELATKTRQDLQGDLSTGIPPSKYVIQSIAPIHHVKFNHVVRIKRKMGANAVEVPSLNIDVDEDIIVKQIEHYYPSGKTVIKVGENDIDFFDDRVEISKTNDSLIDGNAP